jgi:peptidoglycan/LPS O-acetylase OafA/YrhL
MRTQKRLDKISTTISLLGLAMGFSALGLLIVAKEHDGGASITGGILGILLGAAFLIAACLHWKCGDQIQGGFRVEEVPSVEIVSEMRQAANTICSF